MPKKEKPESSLKALSKKERKILEDKIIPEYRQFLKDGNTTERCVDETICMAQEEGVVKYEEGMTRDDCENGFYMFDKSGRQFSIVLFGQQPVEEAGISMIVSHTDSPCFLIREHPIIEHESEGVLLKAKPYGGIWRHQWLDTNFKIIGRFTHKGRTYDLEMDGVMGDRSIHITPFEEYAKSYEDFFRLEMYKIVTEQETKKQFLRMLKKEGLDENTFFDDMWYAVPSDPGIRIGNKLVNFGHDDRVCVYSSVKAALQSKNRRFPAIIHGASSEEVMSTGGDGAKSNYLECSIDNLLKAEGIPEKDISSALQRRLFENSRMLSADCNVALSQYEDIEDHPYQDETIAIKLGKGLSIVKMTGRDFQYEGNIANSEMITYIRHLLDRKGVVYQTSEDQTMLETGGGATVAVFYAQRGVPVIDLGPPVANAHGKNPYLHIGDLAQAIKAYQGFLERKK